jgi:hypothetical protein
LVSELVKSGYGDVDVTACPGDRQTVYSVPEQQKIDAMHHQGWL